MQKKKDHTPPMLKVLRWVFPKVERVAPSLAAQYFLTLFFKPFRYQPPHKEKEMEAKAEKSRHRIGQKEIQFYSWGEKSRPYVLVVHGWAGRATQFRKFIGPFNEAGYRVIGFDGPAHGQSEGTSTTIIEFQEVLKFTIQHWGVPQAIIAHSFGGGASLYSIVQGLPVRKQINIASPVIADEIIKTFLQALNASWSTGLLFKEALRKKFGRTFEEFTIQSFVKNLPPDLQMLVVHDEDDKEVILKHPLAFHKDFPSAQLFITRGLGHNRILKDEAVIQKCIEFVKAPMV